MGENNEGPSKGGHQGREASFGSETSKLTPDGCADVTEEGEMGERKVICEMPQNQELSWHLGTPEESSG